tara:strand:+ start:466 stop:1872 length:1407 start_codon:yes stop_codon:yes gene_type:complete
MLFNDPRFFLFLFIVFTLLFISKKFNKHILLISSYFFYGFWDWRFLLLIFVSTSVDFIIGQKIFELKEKRSKKLLLFFSIAINLGILGFFKYYNFFIDSLRIFEFSRNNFNTLEIILPVGISFYTFQTMSYTIDIYKNEFKPINSFLDFANFVSFFPQLVAGPIERAKNLVPQLQSFNGLVIKNIKPALTLIFLGYIKKVLISDNISVLADQYFLNFRNASSIYALSGLIIFSMQIYFDFSGYSDIARGISRLMGIDLMINFKQPYFSLKPSEFWKRWHISLSSWLKDYLYIPLGGNRRGVSRTYINLMLTMLLGGLWHGASLNFVLWGGMHAVYLIVEKILKLNTFLPRIIYNFKIIKVFGILSFYVLVLFTWIPFRSPDFTSALTFFKKIIFWTGGFDAIPTLSILFLFLILIIIDFPEYYYREKHILSKAPSWISMPIIIFLVIFIFIEMVFNSTGSKPFIYFQF